jgi:hypothetical protein
MPSTLSRRLALATVTTLGLGTATLAAATPAHAADWTTVIAVHKAKAQLCKEPVGDGWRVKIRLDNRNADHTHLAGMSRNDTQVSVRAQAGEVSKVKSLVFQRGDELVVGIGEVTGEGAGGSEDLGRVGLC